MSHCTVAPGTIDAAPICSGPPGILDSYPGDRKWGAEFEDEQLGQPVVANLTDDNGDGVIDLCDVPDVVVIARDNADTTGTIYVLSGSDGSIEGAISGDFWHRVVPALGDIDGDGRADIVATDHDGHVIAMHADGTVLWASQEQLWTVPAPGEPLDRLADTAIALHDLDGDGHPEILAGLRVFNDDGSERFHVPAEEANAQDGMTFATIRPTAVDLDGDGTLEVLFGNVTYDAFGNQLWTVPGPPAFMAVADFDGDGSPEVLLASIEGLRLVSAAGQVLWGPLRPVDDDTSCPATAPSCFVWQHPLALADVDGDGLPEAIINTDRSHMILRLDASGPTVLMTYPVADNKEGWSAGGSMFFDLRGQGGDYIGFDRTTHWGHLWIFPGISFGLGSILDTSYAGEFPYPVLADVDADGSVDMVVTLQGWNRSLVWVLDDNEKRSIPARRIWNQYNYYVTHVNEDGTIPAHPVMPWNGGPNSFRSQTRPSCGTTPGKD
ncbi:Hemolysin-related protein RbmC [Minicystis rosea]|nr:Hemolysin-related protein RbmC [Minicystis rosea]